MSKKTSNKSRNITIKIRVRRDTILYPLNLHAKDKWNLKQGEDKPGRSRQRQIQADLLAIIPKNSWK